VTDVPAKTKAKKAAKKAAPRLSAIEKARLDFQAKFTKNYGEATLDLSGEDNVYEVISTGCLSLDYAMGVGGYVEGRITEIWGADAIGKTTLVLQGIREAQRKHPDMEGTFDKKWARAHGVNVSPDAFYLITPDSAEEVADQMKDCIKSDLFSMVILDSIGAMIPEAEKEKDADEATVALQAKIVTRMVKIAAVMARNTSTVVILINQVRAVVSAGKGKNTTTGGGFALKHVTTHKLELRGGGMPLKVQMDGEERTVGHPVAVMVERNKVAPPKRRAEFTLFHTATSKYGPAGLDKAVDATIIGIKTKVIAQNGAWYTLPNGEKFNGKDPVTEALRANSDLIDQIRDAALATLVDEIIVGDESEPEVLLGLDPETGEIVPGGVTGSSIFGSLTEAMAE
jgi:recombination protein RecA